MFNIKKLLIGILLFASTCFCFANNIFLYSVNGKPEITEVVDNNLVTLDNIVGKTYSLKNGLSIDTSTNCLYSIYIFPENVAINQMPGTQVYFNEYDIEFTNKFKLPEVLRTKNTSLNFSVNGEIYCKANSPTDITINTSMANIIFKNATVFIKSEKRLTHVYVIEGDVLVIDAKSSKKKKELKENDYLVVTPRPVTNGKGMQTTPQTGHLFSMRDFDDEDLSSYKNMNNILTDCLNNTLFININNKDIVGVKLK